jgi:hypothetical protein
MEGTAGVIMGLSSKARQYLDELKCSARKHGVTVVPLDHELSNGDAWGVLRAAALIHHRIEPEHDLDVIVDNWKHLLEMEAI